MMPIHKTRKTVSHNTVVSGRQLVCWKLILFGLITIIVGQIEISQQNQYPNLIWTGCFSVLIIFLASLRKTMLYEYYFVGILCSFGLEVFLEDGDFSDRYYTHGGIITTKIIGVGLAYWLLLVISIFEWSQVRLRTVLRNDFVQVYLFIFLYSSLVSLMMFIVGKPVNEVVFAKEAFFFILPIVCSVVFGRMVSVSVSRIIVNTACSTIMGVVSAMVLECRHYYGDLYFYSVPTFYHFIILIPVFVWWGTVKMVAWYSIWLIAFSTGILFGASKTYLAFAVALIHNIFRVGPLGKITIGWLVVGFIVFFEILQQASLLSNAAAFKVSQALQIFDAEKYLSMFLEGRLGDSGIDGSLFNMLSEIYVLVFVKTPAESLFGTGFGSAIFDTSGLLGLGGTGAYSRSMILSNIYADFHLPLLMVYHWSGVIGLSAFCWIIWRISSLHLFGAMLGFGCFAFLFSRNIDLVLITVLPMILIQQGRSRG